MQISTDFKLFIACAGCLALFGLIAAASYTTNDRLVESLRLSDGAHATLTQLDATSNGLARAEADIQDYLLTGSVSYRRDYEQTLATLQKDIEALQKLNEADATQGQSINHLSRLVERRIEQLNQAILSRKEADPSSSEQNPGLARNLQEVLDQLQLEERRRLSGRAESSVAYSQLSRRVVIGATVLAFLFIVSSAVIIRRDIIRREKSEKALKKAEEKVRNFFENAPIGIFESTPDGRLLSANTTIVSLLGYDNPEEFLHHRNELKTPLYVDSSVRSVLVDTLASKGVIRDYECQWYRKDGSTVWITGHGRRVTDPDGDHFEAMLYDITERKNAQEQLAQVKSQLENILNSATGVSIIATDVQGRTTIFNPGAERMLGYSAEEVIGKNCEIFHHEPEVTERCRELSAKMGGRRVNRFDVFVGNVRGGGHETREWTYVRKDGQQLTMSLTVTGVRNAQKELIGFLSIGTDITERKQAERDRARLEQQLRRKNLELERETQRALEASRMKSEFLANMSHELRTPLNGIIGFAEMIHDEVVGTVSSEQKDFLADILTSARHLLQLINDVLDLSKVEAGKMDFQSEEIHLQELVGEVHGIVKSLSSKKRLRMETDLDPAISVVNLDPRKLKQVLYNYLSNAIKFTPEGGRISVRTRRESDVMFRLEVEDTGIGIKSEDLNKLFVEFQQLDAGAAKRYQGTGLGLALTKRIAEAQGGRVGVESTLGKGSTFFAVLPLACQELHIAEPVITDSQPEGALEVENELV